MKYIIISIIIFFTMIFFGVLKEEKQVIIEENGELVCEEILEHGYLYQNGKIIEMTKKRVTRKKKEKNDDTQKCSKN